MDSAPSPDGKPDDQDWRAPFRDPTISLPTGGGAIRRIGEKFAANPVTGGCSFSIPLPASPGRGGFGPNLALTYDSQAGNGPFGFGWRLDLPAIVRKTEKGLPRYQDGTDTFLVSGWQDLVPVLNDSDEVEDDSRSAPGYVIRRYRPRVEGPFARIERWTRKADGDVHWRSPSADNVLSVYGKDVAHRIHDPADPARIFSWLLCETRDDKGNAVIYDYRSEDESGIGLDQAHERQRNGKARTANRHLERIRYGNATTLLDPATASRPLSLTEEVIAQTRWLFELVFDYGTSAGAIQPPVVGPWERRPDPFSTYRPGFEIRTYRLCHRALMFHHFPDAGLVRSLELPTFTAVYDP